MRTRFGFLLVGLLVGASVLAGCGGSDATPKAEEVAAAAQDSDHDRHMIEAVVLRYHDAATAEDVCDVITAGYERFIDHQAPAPSDPSEPAGDGCVGTIEAAVKDGHFVFETTDATIVDVITDSERAAALVENPAISKQPFPVFLVHSDSGWLVTGENAFVPPGFEHLRMEIVSR